MSGYEGLMDLFGIRSMEEFRGLHRGWVTEALEKQGWRKRQPQWTESIAVGGEGFVGETKERLGVRLCGGKWWGRMRPMSYENR